MNKAELYEAVSSELTAFELQSLSDPIRHHTGLYVPSRPVDIESWYEEKRSVLTRKSNPENDDDSTPTQSDEPDNTSETNQSDS